MNETNEMNTTVAAVALDGLYEVWLRTTIGKPSNVERVFNLLHYDGLYPEMVVDSYDASVVTTPEGDVLDIRLNGDSIGYHAVRNYCLTAGVKVPVSLGQFEINSFPLETFIEGTPCYLLPLFGEEA
jgi:hypothetical protein